MAYTSITGVYRIHCSGNKKVYVGSSVSIRQRLAVHFSALRRNAHTNRHLQNAYDKYGMDSFSADIIQICDEKSRIEFEQEWIEIYNAADPEYGMNNSWTATTTVGFKHSSETKKLLSELAKGRSTDHLIAYWKSMKGVPSKSKGTTGQKWTDAQRLAASISRKGRKAWNKGVPHSEEHKKKISAGGIDIHRIYSTDTRNDIKRLRSMGCTFKTIAEMTGVSLPQCHKIVFDNTGGKYTSSLRTAEKIKGVA